MEPITLALWGILPPVGVALVLRLGLGAGASGATGRRARIAVPLSLALGYLAGQWALVGLPPLSLALELKHSLFPVALVALGLALFESLRGRASLLARGLLAFAIPIYLLDFLWRGSWSSWESVLWLGGLGVGFLAIFGSGRAWESRRGGLGLPLAWVGIGSLTAGALHLGGSSTLAQLEGAWTAALGVLLGLRALACWPALGRSRILPAGVGTDPWPLDLPGSTLIPAALHGSLLLGGVFTSELPGTYALLLGLSALAPSIGPVLCPPGSSPRRRRLSTALSVLLPWLVALLGFSLTLAGIPKDPYAGY